MFAHARLLIVNLCKDALHYPEAGGECLHEGDGCVDLVGVLHDVGDITDGVVVCIPQVLLMLLPLLGTVKHGVDASIDAEQKVLNNGLKFMNTRYNT